MVRGGGERLTEVERLSVLDELAGTRIRSVRAIARSYAVDESAIRQLWKKRATVLQRPDGILANVLATRYRFREATYKELEDLLLKWIIQMLQLKLPVPPSILNVKATTIAKEIGISSDDFVVRRLDDVFKDSVERAAKNKLPGSAGVKYGRPAHVLDAASYIKAAWENVSSSTIKNAFAKADIGVNFSSNIGGKVVKDITSEFHIITVI
ncbi:hypothetical protein H257_00233 [Aphanomyces astaci]|uniref:HTH psq-type domain-containing protein n=1 Tax=Aphanomyces astaci TaxID=112090 RepID=W4HBR8_APHAT|nr:hypothetical protein H257_00233 [Aphanomyces astaci]ETV88714.1 hypothetical protein H257_00233 [Aphanomyces astaci]|eukprot:XP_009821114.1 hypothetical protein H257_00233 [Aphanomyces astaci]